MRPPLAITARTLMTLALAAITAWGQVKSDYEITQSFDRETKALARAIEEATTVVEFVDIESRLMELEQGYAEHTRLLDRALYPDGYEGRLMKLWGQVSYAKGKITIIESQYARISELEAQVRGLTDQVESLTGQNTKMLAEVRRLSASKATIDSLNIVIIQLRLGLRERDKLIFALVDSLFLQYDKNLGAMSDQEKQGVAARLERRNVFSNIRKAINDNLQFLESTALTGMDIAKISAEQRSFASKWRGVGGQLAGVYAGSKSQKAKELALIDTMLVEWRNKLNSRFWSALNGLFGDRQIPVAPFKTAEEFFANMSSYLDEEIRKARDEKDGQRYFRYEAFADSVWDMHLKPSWIPSMLEDGRLTAEQVKQIESKVDEWGDIVSPPLTAVYIVVGLVMIVVLLYLYRRYAATRGKSAETST